jgi:hypothetical protein
LTNNKNHTDMKKILLFVLAAAVTFQVSAQEIKK